MDIHSLPQDIKSELEFIILTITAQTQVTAIYLFGSYANGTYQNGSDIDIYVVLPDEEAGKTISEICAQIRLALCRKKNIDLDLLMGRQSVFERRVNMLTLEQVIAKEGIKLYGN